MPSRNTIKSYVENGYYHIYNRGVEKRIIFQDNQDYKVFLNYLKESLSLPPDPETLSKTFALQGATFKGIPRQPKNFHTKIELVAYCLMPNHFHLLIKQTDKDAMEKFMRSICTRYSMYFNKKYKRVGKLFQGHYKAALILDDKYLLYLSKYIHMNPFELTEDLTSAYSSYADYLEIRHTYWIKPDIVLSFFKISNVLPLKKGNTYKNFVEKTNSTDNELLSTLILEDEDNL